MPTPMNPLTPYRYPEDGTGLSLNNKVVGEVHTLNSSAVRCVAPTYGGFFSESVVVCNGSTGAVLIENLDYYFGELYEFPSQRYGKEICGLIVVKNRLITSVSITYQALGGVYSYDMGSIVRMMEAIDIDARPVHWPDIYDKPTGFTPASHWHDIGDVYGFEYVVHSLERIRQSIVFGDTAGHDEVYRYLDRALNELRSQSDQIIADALEHTSSADNPHAVTKAQVGLSIVENYDVATKLEAEEGVSGVKYITALGAAQAIEHQSLIPLRAHTNDAANPHNVSKDQVGLGIVENYDIASKAEAETGTLNSKYMTPLRTAEAIDFQALVPLRTHTGDFDNPHSTTKAQVGLSNVDNFATASVSQAIAGSSNALFVTPQGATSIVNALVPHATHAEVGKLKTNLNYYPGDDTNADKALTAFGLRSFLLNGTNALNTSIKQITEVKISAVPGNLIEKRPDGLYMGTVAPPNIANLYIDSINGNDGNPGTPSSPMKTLQFALAQGPSGVGRIIYLREDQNHYVYPENPAVIRGGRLWIYPYGPRTEALPPVYGDAKFAQAAASTLNANLICGQYVTYDNGPSGTFQSAMGLYTISDAYVGAIAINFVCGSPNSSGAPLSGYCGSFHHPDNSGTWYLRNCSIHFPHTHSTWLSEGKRATMNFIVSSTRMTGPGIFGTANYEQYNLDWWGDQIGPNGITIVEARKYFSLSGASAVKYNGIKTNIRPTQQQTSAVLNAEYSDKRLKDITGEITNSLSKIACLKAVDFTWKKTEHTEDLAGTSDVGLIAQDVENVFPRMVSESPAMGGASYKMVHYNKFIPVLIQCINELATKVDVLEKKE